MSPVSEGTWLASFVGWIFLTFVWMTDVRAERFEDICKNAYKVKQVTTLSHLSDSVCSLRDTYPSNLDLKKGVQSTLEIIARLQESKTDQEWTREESIYNALTQLSQVANVSYKSNLTSTNSVRGAVESSDSNLSKALVWITQKYGDPKKRATVRAEDYFKDLDSVLLLTHTGKSALDCYWNAKEPNLSGFRFEKMRPKAISQGASMGFEAVSDPKNTKKFIKVMYYNLEIDPVRALEAYTHEMQHGCGASEYSALKASGAGREEKDQYLIVDEVSAFATGSALMKELVKANPELICHRLFRSTLFGLQVLSVGLHYAEQERLLEEGLFPEYSANLYIKYFSRYLPKSAFELNSDGTPKKVGERFVLNPKLLEKLKKAGLKVAPLNAEVSGDVSDDKAFLDSLGIQFEEQN